MRLAGLLLVCSVSTQAAQMTELHYQDQDPGDAPYSTRVLVTERYLRLDNGQDDSDFVLLDRKSGSLVNVVHEQKALTRMPKRPLPKPRDTAYSFEERLVPVNSGTVRVQLLADGKLCSETVAAKSYMPQAAAALAEYRTALAYTQWLTYRNTPDELRQDCDLVQHVWEADRALRHGLPLEERDHAGRTRVLTGSGSRPLKSTLFKLPRGYAEMQPPDSASGQGQ